MLLPLMTGGRSKSILLDSGAQVSITNRIDFLFDISPVEDTTITSFTDKKLFVSKLVGTLKLSIGRKTHNIKCYYLPQSNRTIVAECDLLELPLNILIEKDEANGTVKKSIQASTGEIKLVMRDKLNFIPQSNILINKNIKSHKVQNLHARLGHINKQSLINSIKHATISTDDDDAIHEMRKLLSKKCDSCLQFKAKRTQHILEAPNVYLKEDPFYKVHSDVCFISTGQNSDQHIGFITFRCSFTGYTKVYSLKSKEEVYDKTYHFIHWIKNQFGYSMKNLFTDKGREYLNHDMSTLTTSNGIEHHTTSGYDSQANGVAERLNQTILTDARTMLLSASLPPTFWPEAVNYSVFLRNHIYNSKIDNSPAGSDRKSVV